MTPRVTPAAAAAAMSRSARSVVISSGFSTSTGSPRLAAAAPCSPCSPEGVPIATMSISALAKNVSSVSDGAAPTVAASSRARSSVRPVNGDHGGGPKAVDGAHMRRADVARPDDSDAHHRHAGYPFRGRSRRIASSRVYRGSRRRVRRIRMRDNDSRESCRRAVDDASQPRHANADLRHNQRRANEGCFPLEQTTESAVLEMMCVVVRALALLCRGHPELVLEDFIRKQIELETEHVQEIVSAVQAGSPLKLLDKPDAYTPLAHAGPLGRRGRPPRAIPNGAGARRRWRGPVSLRASCHVHAFP